MNIVAKYTPTTGALAEQFSRSDGTPLSAIDLTWSYASFLTTAARRASQVPYSWGEPNARAVPSSCVGSGQQGTYIAATATLFPPSQTPQPCTLATSVAVTFNQKVTTTFGQTIKIVGSDAILKSWDPAQDRKSVV